MAILPGGIIPKFEGVGNINPVMNLGYGGQFGHIPQVGIPGADGSTFDGWIHGQPEVRRNIIPVLLDYPRFIDFFEDKIRTTYLATIKSVMEVHCMTIEGLNAEVTVNTDEMSFGGTGQTFKVPTNAVIADSSVSKAYKEIIGYSLGNTFLNWIQYGMCDPLTKHPTIHTRVNEKEDNYTLYTADYYAAICAYILPDILLKRADKCWITVNLFPNTSGPIEGKRDKSSDGNTIDITIEYGGISFCNNRTAAVGTSIMNSLKALKLTADTNFAPARLKAEEVVAKAPAGHEGIYNIGKQIEDLGEDLSGMGK